jgi:phosphatidylinositol glycan class B
MWPRSKVARLILWSALIAGLGCRVYVMFTDEGIYWPDEIHQSLEPAHRLVFGYGLIAWEFVDGARNWAFPGAIAGLMRAIAALGGDRPHIYLPVIRLVFVALSLGTALGIYRLARGSGASEEAAAAGAAVWALAAPSIYFAHRAMSENAATVAAVWAVGLMLAFDSAQARTPHASRRSLWLGASLLGLSVMFRIQMGVLVIGALGVLAARRNWRGLLESLAVLSVWGVAFGAVDALTWSDAPGATYGGWFHSAILYLRFNLVEGRSAQWGTSSPGYYAEFVFRSMPIIAACLGIGLLAGLRYASALSVLALLFVVALSAIPHKEFRFILPMLPLAVAATVTSFDALPRRSRLAGIGLLLAGAVASAVTFPSLTWGDLGAHQHHPDAKASAWDDPGPINRLLLAANRQRDLCGLRVDAAPAFHGASTYLHRPVHIYHDVPESSGLYNYAIARVGSGLPVVARDRDMELVRVTAKGCKPDPGYDWRLPP